MSTPFPGMDPWLERPTRWLDRHNRLIAAIADTLGPPLRPRYFARVAQRSYVVDDEEGLQLLGHPDVSVLTRDERTEDAKSEVQDGAVAVEVPPSQRVNEWYLEIHDAADTRIVTAMEILSPWNKSRGTGRETYIEKRRRILQTRTHLVEIDLLRAGTPPPIHRMPDSDYRILISRSSRRPRADLLAFSVRDPIPLFRVPLLPGDDEPELDLGAVLHELYDRAAYDLDTDSTRDPEPPLAPSDATWADAILRTAGLR